MKNFIFGFIVALALALLGALAFGWSGIYNISALKPHWPITVEYIDMLKQNSIRRYSKSIDIMPLPKSSESTAGAAHYHATCRLCHGAPGFNRDEFADSLYPLPPDLSIGNIQSEFTNEEIHWIVENGMKMTGMPGFGQSHSLQELRQITLFIEHLPDRRYCHLSPFISTQAHHHSGDTDH